MADSQLQTLDRWRAFLNKVMGRLRDVLAEAEAGCRDMVASHAADPLPLGNVLGALGSRKQSLARKIHDTWSEQVSGSLADAAEGRAQLPGAMQPRGQLLDQAESEMQQALAWMDDSWEHFRVRWSAEAARALWPHVQASMERPVSCQQCGRPIEPRVRHQAESVRCAACGAVNQVSPEPIVYTYFAMAPHALAEEQALEKRLAITRARRDVEAWRKSEASRTGNWPDEGAESLRRWQAMEREYWEAYADAKARIELAGPEDQKKLVEARMKEFDGQLETNPVWRSAHGMPTR